ncbi:MAG: hypothetical protein UR96_C0044G0005 [candidate division WS6 bacterium GW2011_GWC1_36_11]|uniref:Uncharacterized protein n=2 Tax=Candidatus Dojkabacteria TaxID=74243 RepID=A0A0G0DAL3_9BACT|nr:MAG: hypothetical protein UR96_C0044G0005 [candidate division WS6 bacterium GW2011_GWC1_36_11]KKQ10773.1 MAG: hypothetical protein US24_C0057G0006 [candidate division WS6 bacterium GW2011_GWC2_36_7]HAM96492.1 hypothetical protein [Patescibacteria group bacterium]
MENYGFLLMHATVEYYLKVVWWLGTGTKADTGPVRYALVSQIGEILKKEKPSSKEVYNLIWTIPHEDLLMRDTLVWYLFKLCRTTQDIVCAVQEISSNKDCHVIKDVEIHKLIAKKTKTITEEELELIIMENVIAVGEREKIKKFLLSCRQ